MNILFVCTGNTCRSPMAESLFKKHFPSHTATSAGIMAFSSSPCSRGALDAMDKRGLDLTGHCSQPITASLIEAADLIITMTGQQKSMLLDIFPNQKDKIHTLSGYASGEEKDVTDPFGMDMAAYELCARQIEKLILMMKEKV